jgi:hypothetical protein
MDGESTLSRFPREGVGSDNQPVHGDLHCETGEISCTLRQGLVSNAGGVCSRILQQGALPMLGHNHIDIVVLAALRPLVFVILK